MSVDPALARDLTRVDEPIAVRRAAYAHARSDDFADLQRLSQSLCSPAWLSRLDTEGDYSGDPKSLRIAGVLRRLARNPAPLARNLLVWLTTNGDFVASEPRQELLIQALAMVSPPSAAAIAFWRRHSDPGAVYRHLTVDRMVFNGHDQALALVADQILNERHKVDDRKVWIRADAIRCRYRRPLLEACRRMLANPGLHDLRPIWLEALSSYDADWYPACDAPRPQSLDSVSEDDLLALRGLVRDALDLVPMTTRIAELAHVLLEDIDGRLQAAET